VADKSLAKALKRKMGLDEDILSGRHEIMGDASLLMNPARRRIFHHVCNHPCSHLREISRNLSTSLQTARWHLSKLSEGGLVTEEAAGKKILFYPNNKIIGKQECQLIYILRNNDVLYVYLYIMKHPQATQSAMGRSLDIYQQRLSLLLKSLERAELIGFTKIGREKCYRTTGRIDRMVERLDQDANRYKEWLMDVLRRDGVNPGITDSDKETLTIKLDFGAAEPVSLVFYMNPIAAFLKNEQ
jgi:DNA-binding transcriptional ArsR family regulator